MLLDTQNLFSDAQKITTGTIYSTNTVRFGKNDVSFVPIIIQVVKDFTNLTSLTVKIQTSKDEQFSSAVDLMESTMVLKELKVGAKFPISYLPKGNLGYIRIAYVVTGTTETTGEMTSGVVAHHEMNCSEI